MQRNNIFTYNMSIYLADFFERERRHLGLSLFTSAQRLNLCVMMLKALGRHHAKGCVLGSISLNDFIVEVNGQRDIQNVYIRLPAHANKAAGDRAVNPEGWSAFEHVLPEWIFGENIDEKSDVCMFGQIFMEIWRVMWPLDENEKLTAKMKILVSGEIPPVSDFLALQGMPAAAAISIHDVLVAMTAKEKDRRHDVESLIGKLEAIHARLSDSQQHAISRSPI
ncbi:hypothetical protein AQUSIP_08720 [Aquicella siphonis]|uniref:Protein kinase domain-containing protein n=1 Tax=Aquicella siphonis TaxID=254247 RepID=A0A5E4PGH8_9COXI|nr:hypothetical protein [Aquicella siphonis]VVC75582.1 hypothetical protein AQUSIP_08720 [Aquicella siphonis]